MVKYSEDREYIRPEDHPLGSTIKGVIVLVEEKQNTTGNVHTFYRTLIQEDETGLFASMILSDNISPKNLHGKVVKAVFGEEVLQERTYTNPQTLIDKQITLKVTGWKSKLDRDGNPVSYADVDIADTPRRTRSPPKAQPMVSPPPVCDNCAKPLPKDETMIQHHLEDDTDYQFCSARCKSAFLS